MDLVLDTLESAELQIGFEQVSAVRTGLALNIPAQARSDPYVLARAIFESGGPQLGETHPSSPSLTLQRIVARPTNGTNDAMLQWMYEGPGQGPSAQGVLVIEDDTTLATEIETIDRNGDTIQAIYEIEVAPSDGTGSPTIKSYPKTIECPVLRPRRTLSVSGILFGRHLPASWARAAVGCVNRDNWPTGSLWSEDSPDPPGWWLCTHVSASTDRYKYQVFDSKTRPYRVRASFQSKVLRSWMSYGYYTNFYHNVPQSVGDHADDILKLVEGDYQIQQNHSVNGFVIVGLYRTQPFSQVFGF